MSCGCGEHPVGSLNIDLSRTGFCNIVAEACHLPFKGGVFDGVVASEVLEHLTSPGDCLKEICRVTGDTSLILIRLPKPHYTNNYVYLFKLFVMNFPVSLKKMGFFTSYLTHYFKREPRYFHSSLVDDHTVEEYLDIVEYTEFGDVFLLWHPYWLYHSKYKPKVYDGIQYLCVKKGQENKESLGFFKKFNEIYKGESRNIVVRRVRT